MFISVPQFHKSLETPILRSKTKKLKKIKKIPRKGHHRARTLPFGGVPRQIACKIGENCQIITIIVQTFAQLLKKRLNIYGVSLFFRKFPSLFTLFPIFPPAN